MPLLTREELSEQIQYMMDRPEDAIEIIKDIFSKFGSAELGVTLSDSINKWFGQSAMVGVTCPASLICLVDKMSEPAMRWVIQDSINTCLASSGITSLRQYETEIALAHVKNLIKEVEESEYSQTNLLKLIKTMNDIACITLLDAIELIDALVRDRMTVKVGFEALYGTIKVIQLYVVGNGSQWPVHQGNIKVFGFEVSTRLVALLLKKMIVADDKIEPSEMLAYFEFLGRKYSMPPEQAQWVFDSAPATFDIRSVCGDIVSLLRPERISEIYETLNEIAMADDHLDNREKQLINFIRSNLNISA